MSVSSHLTCTRILVSWYFFVAMWPWMGLQNLLTLYCTWQAKPFVRCNASPSTTSVSTPTDLDPLWCGSLNTPEYLRKTDASLSAEQMARDTFTYLLQRCGQHYLGVFSRKLESPKYQMKWVTLMKTIEAYLCQIWMCRVRETRIVGYVNGKPGEERIAVCRIICSCRVSLRTNSK